MGCQHFIYFVLLFQDTKIVSFKGEGFLELNSQHLKSSSTLGLSFSTNEAGLLLLSTSQGQQQQDGSGSSNLGDFYSLSLSGGKLVLIAASSSDPGSAVRVQSDRVFNDGDLHTVVVRRMGQRIHLIVDGIEVEGGDNDFGRNVGDILSPAQGGLFIGGVPTLMRFAVKSAGMVETAKVFYGNIEGIAFLDDE